MNKGWLELESDPGLFTLLLEDFGVKGVQVEEIYDLQKPIEGTVYGFIFLFRWIEERRSRRKTNSEVESFVTDADAVNKIFFAQQIIPNSCATHALLSVLLNCDNKVKLGKTLNLIKDFTDSMSPEDKGYAIANMPELARVHNSYARPETCKPVPEKQTGLSSVRAMDSETFHFVSYVPIHGHLFELDGLKPHPIDHGPWEKGDGWTEKFRRVITDRLGMATGGEPYHDIRFNLMAVVPDKRQLLEHKLVTLKTNRNIVLEALQQVVSPTSSERSDSEGPGSVKEAKKSVTFSTDTLGGDTESAAPEELDVSTTSVMSTDLTALSSDVSASKPSILTTAASTSTSSSNPTLPSSILKSVCGSAPSSASGSTQTSTTSLETTPSSGPEPVVPSSAAQSSIFTLSIGEVVSADKAGSKISVLEEPSSVTLTAKPGSDDSSLEQHQKTEADYKVEIKPDIDSVKFEPIDSIEVSETIEIKDVPYDSLGKSGVQTETIEVQEVVKTEATSVKEEVKGAGPEVRVTSSVTLTTDVTKPLSIETKFSTAGCGQPSSESTDTASEVGSGFSSPGSLNTSSSQSSPQFSDGNTTGGPAEGGDERPHRKKRRSSHAFTPKDLLYLLKNVEHEIELCETNLKEENEKRKKYKIDACRRTHNYDQFIVSFLSMLAEQGLLGDLMEQSMTGKRPAGSGGAGSTGNSGAGAGNSASSAKVAKKSPSISVAVKKKKPGKIKKRGKR